MIYRLIAQITCVSPLFSSKRKSFLDFSSVTPRYNAYLLASSTDSFYCERNDFSDSDLHDFASFTQSSYLESVAIALIGVYPLHYSELRCIEYLPLPEQIFMSNANLQFTSVRYFFI